MDMYIGIATKMIVGSIGIFILIRLIGKKAVSELTPFDLIYVVILGAIVEESIYDDMVNIFHVLFAIVLWGIVVYVVEKILEHTERLSSLLQGEPSILVEKGKLNLQELHKNHLDMEQLRAMLRQHGCYSIHEVYYAILEVNGALTIISKDEEEIPAYLLVEEGKLKENTLNYIGKNEAWLNTQLAELGYTSLDEIAYCEWDENEQKLLVGSIDDTVRKKVYLDD